MVRLTTICINGCTCITQSTQQVYKIILIPTQHIKVIIDKDGIWPTLTSHLEGLDKPVITCFATAAKSILEQRGVILMTLYTLISHIHNLQIRIVFLSCIHPFDDSIITLSE